MNRTVFLVLAIVASLGLGGCYSHNFPGGRQAFINVEGEIPAARVYVDANGTFYPQHWLPSLDPFGAWGADSLLNEAVRSPDFGRRLRGEQDRQTGELRAFIAGKRRVFIFIHGFNNNQGDTRIPFEMMASRLALGSGDAVLRFHWDGFDDRFPGSPALFWWMAVANSQMAGTRGLRPILQLIEPGQEVFLISHSRGASVILSALSDPPYSPGFIAQTRRLSFAESERLLNPPALRAGPRNIHAIMMAPAIGRVDFLAADCEVAFDRDTQANCDRVREFPRLASLGYTINPCDEVLEKVIGLSNRFNPTDLGLVPGIGEALAPVMLARGVAMRAFRLAAPHDHDFALYTADPEFSAMLSAVNVASSPWATPPAPERCRRSRREGL